MNIFALSYSPVDSARWQHDKHVVKMLLETAQMLSTNASLVPEWAEKCERLDLTAPSFEAGGVEFYVPTYVNHPCTKWARATLGNFRWLCLHGEALWREFDHRFGGMHASYERIIAPLRDLAYNSFDYSDVTMTPFATAMPDCYKVPGDAVQSYRDYYLNEKIKPDSKWTGRDRVADLPSWLSEVALFI